MPPPTITTSVFDVCAAIVASYSQRGSSGRSVRASRLVSHSASSATGSDIRVGVLSPSTRQIGSVLAGPGGQGQQLPAVRDRCRPRTGRHQVADLGPQWNEQLAFESAVQLV
jgi:hypothetical protein